MPPGVAVVSAVVACCIHAVTVTAFDGSTGIQGEQTLRLRREPKVTAAGPDELEFEASRDPWASERSPDGDGHSDTEQRKQSSAKAEASGKVDEPGEGRRGPQDVDTWLKEVVQRARKNSLQPPTTGMESGTTVASRGREPDLRDIPAQGATPEEASSGEVASQSDVPRTARNSDYKAKEARERAASEEQAKATEQADMKAAAEEDAKEAAAEKALAEEQIRHIEEQAKAVEDARTKAIAEEALKTKENEEAKDRREEQKKQAEENQAAEEQARQAKVADDEEDKLANEAELKKNEPLRRQTAENEKVLEDQVSSRDALKQKDSSSRRKPDDEGDYDDLDNSGNKSPFVNVPSGENEQRAPAHGPYRHVEDSAPQQRSEQRAGPADDVEQRRTAARPHIRREVDAPMVQSHQDPAAAVGSHRPDEQRDATGPARAEKNAELDDKPARSPEDQVVDDGFTEEPPLKRSESGDMVNVAHGASHEGAYGFRSAKDEGASKCRSPAGTHSDCLHLGGGRGYGSPGDCAGDMNVLSGDTFNYKDGECYVKRCGSSDMHYSALHGQFDVYSTYCKDVLTEGEQIVSQQPASQKASATRASEEHAIEQREPIDPDLERSDDPSTSTANADDASHVKPRAQAQVPADDASVARKTKQKQEEEQEKQEEEEEAAADKERAAAMKPQQEQPGQGEQPGREQPAPAQQPAQEQPGQEQPAPADDPMESEDIVAAPVQPHSQAKQENNACYVAKAGLKPSKVLHYAGSDHGCQTAYGFCYWTSEDEARVGCSQWTNCQALYCTRHDGEDKTICFAAEASNWIEEKGNTVSYQKQECEGVAKAPEVAPEARLPRPATSAAPAVGAIQPASTDLPATEAEPIVNKSEPQSSIPVQSNASNPNSDHPQAADGSRIFLVTLVMLIISAVLAFVAWQTQEKEQQRQLRRQRSSSSSPASRLLASDPLRPIRDMVPDDPVSNSAGAAAQAAHQAMPSSGVAAVGMSAYTALSQRSESAAASNSGGYAQRLAGRSATGEADSGDRNAPPQQKDSNGRSSSSAQQDGMAGNSYRLD